MSVDPRRGRVAWAQVETPEIVAVTYTKAGHGTAGNSAFGASQIIRLRRAVVAWAQVETPETPEHFKTGHGKAGTVAHGASVSVFQETGSGAIGEAANTYGEGSYGSGEYGQGAGRGLIGSGSRESVFAETGFGTVGTGHFLTMLEPIDTGRLADELGSERGRVGDTVAGVVLEDIEEVAA